MILYYDRAGEPLESVFEWERLLGDREYVIVQKDTLKVGDIEVHVSTIWLGLNHNWLGGRPLIFETMVWWDGEIVEMHRYSTEEEARLGHAGVLEMQMIKADETKGGDSSRAGPIPER